MFPYVMSISPVPHHEACTLLEKPLLDTLQWSKCITLSCGVNSSTEMRSTIQHVVCSLVRQHRGSMPRAALQRSCRDFLRKLEIMVGRKRSDGTLVRPIAPGSQTRTEQGMHMNTTQKQESACSLGSGGGSGGSAQSAATAGWVVAPEDMTPQGSCGGALPTARPPRVWGSAVPRPMGVRCCRPLRGTGTSCSCLYTFV